MVEEKCGDEELEAFALGFAFADAAGVIECGGVVELPPAVGGVISDAVFAADIGDREALGQVAVGFPKEAYDWVGGPSLAQESLLDLSYPDRDSQNSGTNLRGADHPPFWSER